MPRAARFVTVVCLLCGLGGVAGCGGSDPDTATARTAAPPPPATSGRAPSERKFIAAGDRICKRAHDAGDRTRTRLRDVGGRDDNQPVAEVIRESVNEQAGFTKQLAALKPPASISTPWREYLRIIGESDAHLEDFADAADRNDASTAREARARFEAAAAKAREVAGTLGFSVCGGRG